MIKKIFFLTYLTFFLAPLFIANIALGNSSIDDITFSPTSGQAKVGESVTITFSVINSDPTAKWIHLRIWDAGVADETAYHPKTRFDCPQDGQKKSFSYTWVTNAAESDAGEHRVDVVMTKTDENQILSARSVKYTLVPSIFPSAGLPSGTLPSPTLSVGEPGEFMRILPGEPEKWNFETITEIINNVLTFVAGAAGAFAVFLVVWHAFNYFTAFGSEEKTEAAKKGILYTLSGLGIIILAKVLVALVFNFFRLRAEAKKIHIV